MKLKKIALCIGLGLGAIASANAATDIRGKVLSEGTGSSVEGVVVTAKSNVMPKARTAVTRADGSYSLPALLPGNYELSFKAKDGTVQTAQVQVFLDQTSKLNMVLIDPSQTTEVITVSGSYIVREGDSSLTNSIGSKAIESLPVGQDFRDMMKLIPGVQYSENATLGVNAGGSGRDNKYGFDGVDVSLPMFGNLSAEPSTHDIAHVSMDRGGAKAVGFNRSGGVAVNSKSKSGTNEFHANLEYKIQNKNFVADRDIENKELAQFTTDKSWIIGSISGPIIEDELFFYGSFYRPDVTRVNKETAYGPAKDYKSVRDEYFGKFTWAPTEDLLLDLSYRTSDRDGRGQSVGSFDHDSTSNGDDATQDILLIEGSYLIDDMTTLSFKYSEFDYETAGAPDTTFDDVNPRIGDSLPLGQLDQSGLFRVPELDEDSDIYDNVVAQMLIDQYGYVGDDGTKRGGGSIGGDNEFNNQNFYRDSFEISLDHALEVGDAFHNLHIGFQFKESTEVLSRLSNGWGSISYVGGEQFDDYEGDIPVYYAASVQQMSLESETGDVVAPITSSSKSYNIEVNDTIEHGDFVYNVGFVISKDVLYGQDLKANSSNVSGYEIALGHKYKMHTIDFKDTFQPRLGVTWNYAEDATVFANYASYNPEASSLARAASWARNSQKSIDVLFDENGDYITDQPASGSSGKFFQEGIKPKRIDEITIGATKSVTDKLYVKGHVRHRELSHPWEDTPNNARLYGEYGPFGGVPANIAEKGLYIENLAAMRDEIGGSSYVIAELDGAKNTYYEVSLEAEYSADRYFASVSYTWSHYYGNYDQDITSGASDGNLFIGSSNLADGIGRQLWDGKYGKLNGDKPHVFKAYGYYTTDWEANIGAYLVYQSGDVWEKWDGEVFGYASDTIRYAEHAGSRREASHWQMDLNYTQNFTVFDNYTVRFRADLFNVFDNQTGYNYDPFADSENFGKARDLINARRLQLSVNIGF
ncbi:TonB-dependent receptor [Thalassotalea sp. PP2-459]|uniref:TonB-dependent receptor n=1 Tax=Thalassotalea sp. PP2-459 TaxID=1742724 RepID=UPI000945756A|nr:TonB-dependent receptor [Thalassotalea sp. PP2-459]OKY25196.1 TonB-dependent receptor [Thalassotalea sp. PP2-459]